MDALGRWVGHVGPVHVFEHNQSLKQRIICCIARAADVCAGQVGLDCGTVNMFKHIQFLKEVH